MSLRTLSKHRTEATYANQWKHPTASSKAVKHTQYAINRYHRAVRRSQREVIAAALSPTVDPTLPNFDGRPYHCEGWGWFRDDHGLWDIERGRYLSSRIPTDERIAQLLD